MPSQQVTMSLDGVREALGRRGFDSVLATHYDNTPPSHVVLHDDLGQLARGDACEIGRIIESSGCPEDLWSALGRSGMTMRSPSRQS